MLLTKIVLPFLLVVILVGFLWVAVPYAFQYTCNNPAKVVKICICVVLAILLSFGIVIFL